jgi:hypothetical protein
MGEAILAFLLIAPAVVGVLCCYRLLTPDGEAADAVTAVSVLAFYFGIFLLVSI